MTTAIQMADIIAYLIVWGVRVGSMSRPARPELGELANKVCESAIWLGKVKIIFCNTDPATDPGRKQPRTTDDQWRVSHAGVFFQKRNGLLY
ncbi:MAG: hypothetical protein H7833_04805 [Magnetococcus sp. DMHC-1]|nr:hypothetical protein [Magnetococcales bacterium]